MTDMRFMFQNATSFNQDLSLWNVANVTSMRQMFENAICFNQDLSRWNVASVTDMSRMFKNAVKFNSEVENWDVSKVEDMSKMFANCDNFDQSIDGWNISSAKSLSRMLSGAVSFSRPVGSLLKTAMKKGADTENMLAGAVRCPDRFSCRKNRLTTLAMRSFPKGNSTWQDAVAERDERQIAAPAGDAPKTETNDADET